MTRISPADRRVALVEATIRVIARDGMAGASTRAITAEADMALASLHYVFGTREALLEAVVEKVTTDELEAAQAGLLPLEAAGSGLDRLLGAALDRYVDLLVARPERELAVAELTVYASRTGMTDLLAHVRSVYLAAARQSLAEAARLAGTPWLVPLDAVAALLVTLLDGLTLGWLSHRDEETARATGRFAARTLARLAEPQPVSSAT